MHFGNPFQVKAACDEVDKCIDGRQKTFQDQIKAQNPTEHQKIFCDFMEGVWMIMPSFGGGMDENAKFWRGMGENVQYFRGYG